MGATLDNLRTLFELGGWVMYPLGFLSVLALALSFERSVFWLRTHSKARRRVVEQMRTRLMRGDLDGARSLADADSSLYGVWARSIFSEISAGTRVSEGAATGLVEDVRPIIERSGATLSAIITAAPMLGILGTVTGIIQSFQLLGEDAISDPTLVADGIAEALFTTAFGLIVSLVTLFPYVVFRTQSNRALSRLESLATLASEQSENSKLKAQSSNPE